MADLEELLEEAMKEHDDIKNVTIKNSGLFYKDFGKTGFENVIFENCRFSQCDLSGCSFVNVSFHDCDMSNSHLDSAYFKKCQWQSVKAVGCSFVDVIIKETMAADCNFQYSNFHQSNVQSSEFICCDFSHGAVTASRHKKMVLSACRIVETNFFGTPLGGLDFSDCNLSGIIVSDTFSELRGAVVNPFQSVELAKLLGVVIKE